MTTPLDRAFFAGDAHDHWARRINTADKSIWILTPQIDETLVDLLDGATAPEVVVLTSVRPDVAGPDYRQHLLGVRALLANGIDVRSTIRPLSAHVLVCDGRLVTAGSQPFNADGRTVDAVTCGPENNIDGSGFQVTIRSWMDAGRSLEMVVVETLLDVLDVSISVVENAQRDLIDEFEFVSAGMMVGEPDAFGGEPASAVTDDAVLHRSEHRELRSGTGPDGGVLRRVADGLVRTLADDRRASGERVFARLQMNGEGWDSYWSLVPDGDADLTEWVQPLQDGSTQRVRLERLMVYPVILNPSGRMGFARVGKTRITYVREAVHWTSGVAVAGSSVI